MKAGWHGHPISDGRYDRLTCACAHQSILVFQLTFRTLIYHCEAFLEDHAKDK